MKRWSGRPCSCTKSTILVILLSFLYPIFPDRAWSQTRTEITQLQNRLQVLARRVASLEKFHRSIVCGRMDSDLLKEAVSMYPSACQLDRDRPPLQIEPPRLKATLVRPGVFRFEFDPPKPQKPLVLATALKSWGSVPKEISSLRVADVSQTGFTIETFEAAGPINPSNVSFFFVVLAEPSRAD
jgi:hypothetical protein